MKKELLIDKTTELVSGYLESAGIGSMDDSDKSDLNLLIKEFVESRTSKERFDEPTINFTLLDQNDYTNALPCKMNILNTVVYIQAHGYGDQLSAENEDYPSYPIGIEFYEDRFRVLAWNDINEADPVIIDMEKARESNLILK